MLPPKSRVGARCQAESDTQITLFTPPLKSHLYILSQNNKATGKKYNSWKFRNSTFCNDLELSVRGIFQVLSCHSLISILPSIQ